MENDKKNSKWKTTKKIKNGRRPKKLKMEDDQKIKNGRRPKKSKWKAPKKFEMKTTKNI